MDNSEVIEKSGWPLSTRIIAFVLVVVLVLQLGPFFASGVVFSADKYKDSEYSEMADYIEENDDYLSSSRLQRMRETVRLLGKPSTYDEYSLFASVAIADEKYTEAAQYLLRCIELFSGDRTEKSNMYVKLGAVCALDDDWLSCIKHMNKAVELDPENADGWLMLAEANLRTENYEESIEALNTYSTLQTLDASQYYAIASMKINLGDYEGAVNACSEALNMENCDKAEVLLLRAQAYQLVGRFNDSLNDTKECLALDENNITAMTVQANSYECMEEYTQALTLYKKVIDLGASDADTFEHAVQCAYMAEDYDAMAALCDQALKLGFSEDRAVIFKKWLGLAQLENGSIEEASKNIGAYIEYDPNAIEMYYFRGVCYMSLEQYELAEADFSVMIDNELMLDECLYNRAMCRMMNGKLDEAAVDFQTVIDRGENKEIIELIFDLLGIDPEAIVGEQI